MIVGGAAFAGLNGNEPTKYTRLRSEWERMRGYVVTELRSRKVIEDAESTAKHRLPILTLTKLIGNADSRCDVSKRSVERGRSCGRRR